MNLLGGRLFDEQMANHASSQSLGDDSVASDRMGSYQASHRLVLTRTYEYFFQRGIAALVKTVERAVGGCVGRLGCHGPCIDAYLSRDGRRSCLQDS